MTATMTAPAPDTTVTGYPTCNARTKGDTRCRRPAGWGTPHAGVGTCKLHGGSTPDAVKHGQRILVERHVAEVTARWHVPDDVSIAEFFQAEMRRSAATVAYLDERVSELSDRDLVFGVTRIERNTAGEESQVAEAAQSVWWTLWRQERRHALDVAKTAASVGIEDRLARLEEAKVELLAQAVEAAIEAGGGDVTAAKRVMAERLRELDV